MTKHLMNDEFPSFPLRSGWRKHNVDLELSGEGSCVLNPMQMGSPDELATLFARMAGVELTAEERHTTVQILGTLPEGATMRDFIDACDARLAQDMGITPEQLVALRPLLKALAAYQ